LIDKNDENSRIQDKQKKVNKLHKTLGTQIQNEELDGDQTLN
jgi:hypothetical protein